MAAESISFGERLCTLPGAENTDPARILKQTDKFDCDKHRFAKATDHIWLKADIGDLYKRLGTQVKDPVLRYRAARQGPMTVTRVYENGRLDTQSYNVADIKARWRSPFAVSLPLADTNGALPETILIGVQDPWDPSNWYDVEIMESSVDLAQHEKWVMLSALFTGLFFAPLILDLVFFSAIRQRFILFHAIMSGSILINHICWTGQIFALAPWATMEDRSWIAHIALAGLGFGICMLIRSLCDPEKMGWFMRKALLWAATASLLSTILVMIFAPVLPLVGSQIFHLFYGLMVLTCMSAIIYGVIRGDRMAMLLALALSVAGFVAISRILRALGLIEGAPVMELGFNIAVLFEAMVTGLIVGHRTFRLRRANEEARVQQILLERLANTDELTGLANRRVLQSRFSDLKKSGERRPNRTAFLLLDIDHFKKINDQYGHNIGDRVLIELAKVLQNSSRASDLCVRFGGEEFVILAHASAPEDLADYAQRLCEMVASHDFSAAGKDLSQITVSIGLVLLPAGTQPDFDDIYKAADTALYQSKKDGRNRVSAAFLAEVMEPQAPEDDLGVKDRDRAVIPAAP